MISTRTAMGGAAATLAAAALACVAGSAAAQPMSLRDQLFGAPSDERAFSIPTVARFQTELGEPFVLDRSPGRQVFMKFEASPEIWALDPTPGPRGDMIYKNDMGEPMLRSTRLGGLTLFTQDHSGGVAAAFVGQASLLRPAPVFSPGALLQAFAQASERAARAMRHPISFEAEDVPLTAMALIGDTATVTAEAFSEVAGRGDRARQMLERFSKVRIGIGAPPSAKVSGQTVRIAVDPDRGLAGRPSSHRIAAAISRH
ncbi:MAG TPA: DUF4908 domain-containing protein [Caulobacteraceae bacterium]|jgi:hypothetical protein|nr:DUF4908 domain-containing protein [Caulobacteraceae bacterium]